MFISTSLEQYRSRNCKIRNACKTLIRLDDHMKNNWLGIVDIVRNGYSRTQRSDRIPSLLIQEDPLILARDDTEKPEALSEYFSKVFSIGNGERQTIHCNCSGSLMDPAVIEKGTVLRLLQHLKPDKSSGPDDIHPRFMKAISDIIAELLATLFDIFLSILFYLFEH
ncbi:hypothetical protein MS3_00000794 [Schistosoma haematobium]|uniref:Uncharacterized protein n=1 Tax=Schistosoma haematobium TaxID=6185 RepID=A0A922IIK6_SCHHA|nr:hypothetical protein MS3_00000794 [Schistosoma haematobium]KAH9579639.1 hypothetical protein MS3_00000794 [Schistosoma haematobium]